MMGARVEEGEDVLRVSKLLNESPTDQDRSLLLEKDEEW
jgi:hypothetical protein